jgi:CRP-like cAMP-binding protein
MGLDRAPSEKVAMTQEVAAGLLGVRREGVTAAAHKLQRAGVIRYARGRIAVLDRQGLEQRTCELNAYRG